MTAIVTEGLLRSAWTFYIRGDGFIFASGQNARAKIGR